MSSNPSSVLQHFNNTFSLDYTSQWNTCNVFYYILLSQIGCVIAGLRGPFILMGLTFFNAEYFQGCYSVACHTPNNTLWCYLPHFLKVLYVTFWKAYTKPCLFLEKSHLYKVLLHIVLWSSPLQNIVIKCALSKYVALISLWGCVSA